MWVDSHCHLNFPEFSEDLPEVLARAGRAGVSTFLSICTMLNEAESIQAIATENAAVFCTVGVHPHEASKTLDFTPALKTALEAKLQHPKVVGLGETGLDYYYNHSDHEDQKKAFAIHCELSLEYDLPIIIHTRNADEETIAVVDQYPNVKGVFHCFSGSQSLAEQALARGFYLSASGIVTFKKAEELREVFKSVPLERLLIETDAPYLAPVPFRGKRNESAFMIETAKVLSELKGISEATLAHHTTENFYRLFAKVPQLFSSGIQV